MPRSDEAASFFYAVYAAVQEIPYGKVTSYGHIAALIGTPQRPRQVGICLKHLPAAPEEDQQQEGVAVGNTIANLNTGRPRFHAGNVPWQRVVNAQGRISPRGGPDGNGDDGRQRQAEALQAEGVEVTGDGRGGFSVNLKDYGWFPQRLPSEEGSDDIDDDDHVED